MKWMNHIDPEELSDDELDDISGGGKDGHSGAAGP